MKQLLQQLVLYTWISLCVLTFILGILQIYAYHRFTTIQHLVIIQKRYPTIVKVEAIAAVFLAFITIPIWSNDSFKATNFGIEGSEEYLYEIGTILTVLNMHFIADIEVGRLWLISFNLHYLHASKNQQWKSQIDHSFAQKDWYLKNLKTYGNKKYVITRVFIWFVISTAIPLILFYTVFGFTHLHWYGLVDALFYSIPVIIIIYTYYKCPKDANDNFLFHYEFRITVTIYGLSLIAYFINQIVFFMGFIVINHSINTLLAMFVAAPPSLLSTVWVPRKILSLKTWNQSYRDVLKRARCDVDKHATDVENPKMDLDAKLYETLKHEKTFEIFVEWMAREFSSESILCFIELVQFKEYIVQYIQNKNVIDNESYDKYLNCLYNEIPKSNIVSENNNIMYINEMDRIKNISHLLFEKYIQYDSEFEINIAAKLRIKYITLNEQNWNVELKDLPILFDPVLKEVFGFMRDSFARYCQ
eukprot:81932_1